MDAQAPIASTQLRTPGPWAGAIRTALRSRGGRLASSWLGLVLVLGVFAPLLSSGHPLVQRTLDPAGSAIAWASPLVKHLTHVDVFLLAAAILGFTVWLLSRWVGRRGTLAIAALGAAFAIAILSPSPPEIQQFDGYAQSESRGVPRNTYVLNRWSPDQGSTERRLLPPGASGKDGHPALLGTDMFGQDVLSQMLSGCRLAISVGIVATGVAILIGVAIGALMGYFGGWVDAVLMRVVEIFMSVPTLFLLVTAAAVLPRNTYVLMGVIGACSWEGSARFVRAEFKRLKEMDFVTAARAGGIGTRSIIMKHILPAAVTPVLVEASFLVASAVLVESSLSYLGLGPSDQASWGRLLAGAVPSGGEFHWWLAVFPGAAIFLTVLAYNVLGQAVRDAMNPKDQA